MRTRLAKVNELIRQQLAEIVRREIDLPRSILVTITRAETSVDLRHVDVSVSVLPARAVPSTLRRLRTKLNVLQRLLNARLSMRPVPRLRFVPDRGEQHAARIETLLATERRELGEGRGVPTENQLP